MAQVVRADTAGKLGIRCRPNVLHVKTTHPRALVVYQKFELEYRSIFWSAEGRVGMADWSHENQKRPRCRKCHVWAGVYEGVCPQCLTPEQKAVIDALRYASKVVRRVAA